MLQTLEARAITNANHPPRGHNGVGRQSLPEARQGRSPRTPIPLPPAGVRPPRNPVVLSTARARPSRSSAVHSAPEILPPNVFSPPNPASGVPPPSDPTPVALPHSNPAAGGVAPGGNMQGRFGGEFSQNTGGAYVLSNPDGQIEITGGTYNAVAGHHIAGPHISVVVQNGMREEAHANPIASEPVPKNVACAPNENTREVEAARREPSPSYRTAESSPTSPSMISVEKSNDSIYYRSLASKKRGSPLWMPEPNKQLSTEYQRNGLMICDVGLISDRGYFDTLYNISLPADHPLAINSDELPESFSPLRLKPRDIIKYSEFKRGSSLSSESIKKIYQDDDSCDLIFESSASEGAILTLPDGSNSQDLGNKKKLQVYLSAHGEEMYRCALNGHGRMFKNGDLRVVTGYDKTTNWGMAAFSNSTAQEDSFRLKFRPKDQGSISKTHSWEYSGTAEVKAGPDIREVVALRMGDPSEEDKEYENQCVFVRTHNMTLREDIWKKLLVECGEIEVNDRPDTPYSRSTSAESFPSGGSSRNSSQSTSTSGNQSIRDGSRFSHLSNSTNTLPVHPSNGINEMLLKLNPSARIAITGDEDWMSVLTEEDAVLPPVERLWDRILKSFVIREEDGVVFLEKATSQPTWLSDQVSSAYSIFDPESKISTHSKDELLIRGGFEFDEETHPTTIKNIKDVQIQDIPDVEATRLEPSASYNSLIYIEMKSCATSISVVRSTWDILWTRLATILACSWLSGFPALPALGRKSRQAPSSELANPIYRSTIGQRTAPADLRELQLHYDRSAKDRRSLPDQPPFTQTTLANTIWQDSELFGKSQRGLDVATSLYAETLKTWKSEEPRSDGYPMLLVMLADAYLGCYNKKGTPETLPSSIQNDGADGTPVIYNLGDISFVICSMALVWIMIPGVSLAYSGLLRRKNALSMIWTSLMFISFVTPQRFSWDFSWAFSKTESIFNGDLKYFGLNGIVDGPSIGSTQIFSILLCIHQLIFAAITAALAVGAIAERGRLGQTLVFIFVWSTLVYDLIACWTWNTNGWSFIMGGLDLAGGTPVHLSSGTAALAISIYLGKHRGYGPERLAYKSHNVAYVILGTVFLWFGWFGFSGGSTLSANLRAVQACIVTNLTASVGGLTWMLWDYRIKKKWSAAGFCSGAVSGLVVMTPASGFVGAPAAVAFGVVGGTACNFATQFKFIFGYDDTLDIFATHAVGGIVGNILTGFFVQVSVAGFDDVTVIPGSWLDHNWIQLGHQLADALAGLYFSFVRATIILWAMNLIPDCRLRPSEEAKILGIDDAEMSEFVYDHTGPKQEIGHTVDTGITAIGVNREPERAKVESRYSST